MTAEDTANIQAWAAIAQVFLAVVIGVATVCFAAAANRLAKLQTAASIEPDVSIYLHTPNYVVERDDPLNLIGIKNHAPLELDSVSLSAKIFGQGAGVPSESDPAVRHLELPTELPPYGEQVWSIDQVVDEAVELVPFSEAPIKHVFNVFVKLVLKYRRKADGAAFQRDMTVAICMPVGDRPLAAYPPLRAASRVT